MKTNAKKFALNMRIDRESRDALAELAEWADLPRSEVVRTLITTTHRKLKRKQETTTS